MLLNYGTPVQYSVFECLLPEKEIAKMKKAVYRVIRPQKDHVRFYSLCASCLAKVETTALLAQVLSWIDSAIRAKQNLKIELPPISEGLLKSLVLIDSLSLYRFRDYIVEKIAAMKRQSNLNAQLLAEELTSRWLDLRGLK